MPIPPVVQTTDPDLGAVVPSAIIEIGHVESGTLANDNGASPPVEYLALQRGTLVTKDSVSGQYLPTLVGGLDAQGAVNVMALTAGEQREILTEMKVGDVGSFFDSDGVPISADHTVTVVGTEDYTVDGAAVTIPAGGGEFRRNNGTYTGTGTGVLLDGEWFQVGVSGVPATRGAPIYADMGAQILLSGTINPLYVTQGTTAALALLPGALLQVDRPSN